MASFDQCAYYDTANRPEQQHKGVVVVDASDPRRPVASAYLDARSMLDPWESLKVNAARKFLAAVESGGGRGEQPGFAVYDISDCRHPVLKSSVDLGVPVKGHAGHFAPDGRTYYGTQIRIGTYPINIDNPSEPKLLGVWPGQNGVGVPHDLSLNAAGDRLYTAQPGGQFSSGAATSNGSTVSNGLVGGGGSTPMMRARIRGVLLAVLIVWPPSAASAHVFVQPYTLPVPFWMYLYACAAALIVSFAVVGYFVGAPATRPTYRTRDVLSERSTWQAAWSWGLRLLKAGAVASLLLTTAAGLIGTGDPTTNINMTLFYWQRLLPLVQPLWGSDMVLAQVALTNWYIVYQRLGLVLMVAYTCLGLWVLSLPLGTPQVLPLG
jgi:hypothetical protein